MQNLKTEIFKEIYTLTNNKTFNLQLKYQMS